MGRQGRRLGGLLLVFGALLFVSRARADAPPKVVVLAASDDPQELARLRALAHDIDGELTQRAVPHLDSEEALHLFEQRHSRAAVPFSANDIEGFVADAKRGLDAASEKDWTAALRWLESAMQRGALALESANRNLKTGRQLWQACLLAVQVLAEEGNETAARAQALDCRVRSPGMELPDKMLDFHPVVRRLLAEAQRDLDRERGAPITVVTTDNRKGCPVRINGYPLGTTPFTQPKPARTPYLIQVECDDHPGRVHAVTPTDQPGALPPIDVAFERAVQTQDGLLYLQYQGPNAAELRPEASALRKHVQSIQQALGDVPFVLVITRPQAGRLRLQRLGGDARSVSIFLDEAYSHEGLAQALSTLLQPVTESSGAELTADDDKPAARGRPKRLRRRLVAWQMGLGISALAAGAALSSASIVALHQLHLRGEQFFGTQLTEPAVYYTHARAWAQARTKPYVFAATGSGLMLSGVLGLALAPAARALPWWSAIVAGSLGVSLATWGIVDITQGSSCSPHDHPDTRVCARERDQRDKGALLVLLSAPALSVLAVKLAQLRPGGSTRSASVYVEPQLSLRSVALTVGLRM